MVPFSHVISLFRPFETNRFVFITIYFICTRVLKFSLDLSRPQCFLAPSATIGHNWTHEASKICSWASLLIWALTGSLQTNFTQVTLRRQGLRYWTHFLVHNTCCGAWRSNQQPTSRQCLRGRGGTWSGMMSSPVFRDRDQEEKNGEKEKVERFMKR